MSTSTISHFINPQVIKTDDTDAKIEAAVDFIPIPVHAVYKCDLPIQIKCINTTPNDLEATFQVQDLDGNALDANTLKTIFENSLSNMRHVEISGNSVIEASLLGSNLTLINDRLSKLMYPTHNSDVNGNFTLKKEIFKSLSSYLTNHISLSLTNTFIDVSGNSISQLNSPQHIANELLRLGTAVLDASGDDTKSYLNTYLDINNSVEVFGLNTINQIIFIIASNVSVQTDVSESTGIQSDSLTAIESIEYRNNYDDELGDPLVPSTGLLNGIWYAALCFEIALENTNVYVSSGPKKDFSVSLYDPSDNSFIYQNSTRTNDNGQIVIDPDFSSSLDVIKVIAKNIDGSGYDTITLEKNLGLEMTTYLQPTSTTKNVMCTTLTSMLVNIFENEGITLDVANISAQKSELASKLSSHPDFSLDINPYSSSTNAILAKEISKTILEVETLQQSMSKILESSTADSQEVIQAKVLKGMAKVFKQSSTTVDMTNVTEIDKMIEESVKETLGQATDATSFKTINRTALTTITTEIKIASESAGSLSNVLTEMHKKKKKIFTAIETNDVSSINTTVIDNQTVTIEDAVIFDENTTTSEPEPVSEPEPEPESVQYIFDFNFVLNVGSPFDGNYNIYVQNQNISFEEYKTYSLSRIGQWGYGNGTYGELAKQSASYYADIYNSNTNNSGLVVRISYQVTEGAWIWKETIQTWEWIFDIGYFEVDGNDKYGPFEYAINNLTPGRWALAEQIS